jgi:Rod binding domain-containing protein
LEKTQVKNVTAPAMITNVPPLNGAGQQASPTHDAQLKKVAHQFEAMFMTEMVRNLRPSNHASGAFEGGKSEETMRGFMDQALGEAAAANGPAGDGSLRRAIEKAVRDADGRTTQGQMK